MIPSPESPPATSAVPGKPLPPPLPPSTIQAWRRWGVGVGVWSLLFAVPLIALSQLAWKEDLYSHALLIPVVTAYLIWTERQRCPAATNPDWLSGLILLGAAGGGLALATLWTQRPADERLALQLLAYVAGVIATVALLLGRPILRTYSFAFTFLIFLVPLPTSLVNGFETALQHGSADVADWFFVATRTPSIREGLVFRLPGLTIEVAQECSGFRSTLVLFIVSTLAARMFLVTPWKQALLIASIVPLGLARNAFRIYTLAALSIEVDPAIMHSALHKRGGPLFFALSLIPLNLLLWGLYRSERRRRAAPTQAQAPATTPAPHSNP